MNCLQAAFSNGVNDCLLVFDSYKLYRGKYALQGLPNMFAKDEADADTLEIVLKDIHEEFYVQLYYGVFEVGDVITRAAVLRNESKNCVRLSRVMSACVEFNRSDMDLIHFYGKHAGERNLERTPLFHGITELRSTGCLLCIFSVIQRWFSYSGGGRSDSSEQACNGN